MVLVASIRGLDVPSNSLVAIRALFLFPSTVRMPNEEAQMNPMLVQLFLRVRMFHVLLSWDV